MARNKNSEDRHTVPYQKEQNEITLNMVTALNSVVDLAVTVSQPSDTIATAVRNATSALSKILVKGGAITKSLLTFFLGLLKYMMGKSAKIDNIVPIDFANVMNSAS